MHSIEVAGYGWEFSDALERFYPADLPAEWRLAFYANEFSAVVVPAVRWQSASVAEVAAWGAEVDELFRFYWELPQDHARHLAKFARVVAPLAAKTGGVVVHGEPGAALLVLVESLALPLAGWPQHTEVRHGALLGVALASRQPRQLRTQLEQLCGGSCRDGILVCDDLDTLRQAKLVAQLSGVSRSG